MLRLFSLLLVGLVFTSLQACQSSHLTSGIEIGTKLVGAELARDKCPPAEYFYLEKGCADPGSGFPKMYATRWEVAQQNNNMVCHFAKLQIKNFIAEVNRRGLNCLAESGLNETASTFQTNENESAPKITLAITSTTGKKGKIQGRVFDAAGVAEITISGQAVKLNPDGTFKYQTFVPLGGKDISIEVTNNVGLTSTKTVTLIRQKAALDTSIIFDHLDPLNRLSVSNSDALALIIGIETYENTSAKAVFADADAMMFRDYASEKLGIPDSRIKTMVNDGAGERELLLSVKSWLSRSVKQNQSDVYIFFAGHGLASDDGSKMYLLPYDGAPELLDDTAISRERLFADISAANPRSVTVFLDTCYSGTTRGTDMLIASRPIAIRALKKSIPDNFTVMTAAAGDETAKPLEEAKHGMFSYFLMKGMEGEADANNDNEITAGELHSYVQSNVIQQSSGSQTPELQGDADRVLVRFQ